MALSKILPASQEQYVGARNLIINGNMACSQRGTQSAHTQGQYEACDRFLTEMPNQKAGTWQSEQTSDVPSGEGFSNSIKMTCTSNKSTLEAGSYLTLAQRLEAQDLQHLSFGSSSAKKTTFSFWVKSNKTGTYVCYFYLQDDIRIMCQTFTIDTTDTWKNITIEFDGDTTGVIDNDNGYGAQIGLVLLAGTDRTSGTQNNGWASYTAADLAPSQTVNLADTDNNYIYWTGVQLEVGEVATPFEHEPFAVTLQKCQRYYTKSYNYSDAPATVTSVGSIYKVMDATISYGTENFTFPVKMRATPTITLYATDTGNTGKLSTNAGGGGTTEGDIIVANSSEAGAAGQSNGYSVSVTGYMRFHFQAVSEL
jgi:hypothetical protein